MPTSPQLLARKHRANIRHVNAQQGVTRIINLGGIYGQEVLAAAREEEADALAAIGEIDDLIAAEALAQAAAAEEPPVGAYVLVEQTNGEHVLVYRDVDGTWADLTGDGDTLSWAALTTDVVADGADVDRTVHLDWERLYTATQVDELLVQRERVVRERIASEISASAVAGVHRRSAAITAN